ncbi:MAG: hypothetical protein ACKO14_00175 [Armatimonadota bacterium]
MTDPILDLLDVAQPLRALMYEKLVWKHLVGIGIDHRSSRATTGVRIFTYHKNGNIQTILGVIGFLVIVEGIAIDFFIATKSTKAAIILGLLHFAMLLYTVALIKASSHRPILVSDDGILVRISLLYSCWIPMSNLKSVRVLDKEMERVNASDVLWCALGDPPNVMIELTDPQETVLPFGIIRRPTRLYFYLDAPGEFVRDVNC